MKARYTTENGRITFEVEGETTKAIFAQMASIQEVFDAEHTCGMCDSADIRLLARKVDDYDFYELACQSPNCRARFEFGQAKKGGALFPKRKDEDGKWLNNRGWSRYVAPGGNGSQSGNGHAPEPGGNGTKIGDGQQTPEGLQQSFDRIADLLGTKAATRTSACLDQIRDAMHAAAKTAGTAQFDTIFRNHTGQNSKWGQDAKVIKRLLAELVEACRGLEIIR